MGDGQAGARVDEGGREPSLTEPVVEVAQPVQVQHARDTSRLTCGNGGFPAESVGPARVSTAHLGLDDRCRAVSGAHRRRGGCRGRARRRAEGADLAVELLDDDPACRSSRFGGQRWKASSGRSACLAKGAPAGQRTVDVTTDSAPCREEMCTGHCRALGMGVSRG